MAIKYTDVINLNISDPVLPSNIDLILKQIESTNEGQTLFSRISLNGKIDFTRRSLALAMVISR